MTTQHTFINNKRKNTAAETDCHESSQGIGITHFTNNDSCRCKK